MAAGPMETPRRDDTARDAIADASRTEPVRPLTASVGEHVAAKGGRALTVLRAGGFVQLSASESLVSTPRF